MWYHSRLPSNTPRRMEAAESHRGLISGIPSWTYDDRSKCQEVASRVWLGPHTVGKEESLLAELLVTDVLLVRSTSAVEIANLRPRFPSIRYHVIEVADSAVASSLGAFRKAADLIHELLTHSGNVVLVLGATGTSRSPAVVVAYLIAHLGLSSEIASEYLLLRRRCVAMSDGLKRQLVEFEVLSRIQFGNTQPVRSKRQFVEEEGTDCGVSTNKVGG